MLVGNVATMGVCWQEPLPRKEVTNTRCGLLTESQGNNLALTILRVPHLLDRGWVLIGGLLFVEETRVLSFGSWGLGFGGWSWSCGVGVQSSGAGVPGFGFRVVG